MTGPEWIVLGLLALRIVLAMGRTPGRGTVGGQSDGVGRAQTGGLIAEAIGDASLVLPCYLIQHARVFAPHAWSVTFPDGAPVLGVVYAVALVGLALTLAERAYDRLRGPLSVVRGPWGRAAVDLVVLAAVAAGLEAVLAHAGAWRYHLVGPAGTVPHVGIPWAVPIGAGGFGLFFAHTIRQHRRWTADALGGLAHRWWTALGAGRAAAVTAPGRRVGPEPVLRRLVGVAVLRLLDL